MTSRELDGTNAKESPRQDGTDAFTTQHDAKDGLRQKNASLQTDADFRALYSRDPLYIERPNLGQRVLYAASSMVARMKSGHR